jgi:putative chitinase
MRAKEFITESLTALSQWENDEPVKYVKHLTKFFGTPDELTYKRAVWYNKDGFKRVVVLDEFILHTSPSPHYDYVYSYVDMKVPHNLTDDLARSSESILVDHLKGEVGGRCASLTANAVTIQYVIDVIEGNVEPSKEEYENRINSMHDMFDAGEQFELEWWPDSTNDASPDNEYYAEATYNENFADGKKPGRKGLAKRSGVNTKASVSALRKTAKNSTGEKARMAHWMANMKAGRAKSEDIEEGWKDWVAGATLGAAALGANASNMVQQIVEPGDTVYSIARQNGVSPQDIMKLNNFNRDTKLVKGQTVTVPDNAKDIKSPTAKSAVKPASVGKPEAKAPVANNKIQVKSITNNPVEDAMRKIALRAGIVGTELAAFMAQVAHESHDFQSMVEYGGSLDFRKYDPKYAPKKAKTLGNTKAGDGAKYKGRGFIQITGRYNYQIAGEALGLDLVKYPELAEKPGVAAKIAVWYWKLRVQPNVENFNDVVAVTKPINPGMRGLEDRKENFKNYMQVAMK